MTDPEDRPRDDDAERVGGGGDTGDGVPPERSRRDDHGDSGDEDTGGDGDGGEDRTDWVEDVDWGFDGVSAADHGGRTAGDEGDAASDEGDAADHGGIDADDVDWTRYGSAPAETPNPLRQEEEAAPPAPDSVDDVEGITPPQEEVVAALQDYFETPPWPDLADAPAPSVLADSFFDFGYADDCVEVERTWAWEPYSYDVVLYDPDERDYRYRVVEPTLDDFEQYVLADLERTLRDVLLYESLDDEDRRREVFVDRAIDVVTDHAGNLAPGVLYKVLYYLQRDFVGYGRIDPLMRDRFLEDISCDGEDVPIYVYHRNYRDLETNVQFDQEELSSFLVRLAQQAGRHVSTADPMVDASLTDGSRIQMTLGDEVSSRGSNFTIRRFDDVPFTPVDLLRWNTFSVEQMAYFWLCIENNMSLLFAGGTASGKTTSMNAVSQFIPRKSKVVSIEDTREVNLPHDNWIQSVTRESFGSDERGEVDMYQLLQSALRQRPEYLLVGEIRTDPEVALAFFQAMATGHTAYTTFHADSAETVLSRLQNPPLSVPTQMVQQLDVLAVQRQIFRDGRRVRRNVEVVELGRDESGTGVATNRVFRWNPRQDGFDRPNDSKNLAAIREMRGWSTETLRNELERRERFLRTMVDRGLTGYDRVSEAIRRFQRSPADGFDFVDSVEDDVASPTPVQTHE